MSNLDLVNSPVAECNKCGDELTDDNWHTSARIINSRRCSSCVAAYNRRYRYSHRPKYLYYFARDRAKNKGIEFTITESDIVIPERCPILGIPLQAGAGTRHDSPSLDRIDNSKGYIPGNVAVISFAANTFKGEMTVEHVEQLLIYMKSV